MTVATETSNGLILYINIVAANRSILLTSNFFKVTVSSKLSWLNLEFGIHDICFYDAFAVCSMAVCVSSLPLADGWLSLSQFGCLNFSGAVILWLYLLLLFC